MSFRRIDPPRTDQERAQRECLDPGHNPPSHIVLEPGAWEWECPACKRKCYLNVPRITC